MSAEPEDDDVSGLALTPCEWACWALLGNPHVNHMPIPLIALADRIAQAVREAITEDRERRRKS